MEKPTERQILGARVRAARESFEEKHRKKLGGGWLLPPRKDTYAYLSDLFQISPHSLSFFFTYSRFCSHEWGEGACVRCPPTDHFPLR